MVRVSKVGTTVVVGAAVESVGAAAGAPPPAPSFQNSPAMTTTAPKTRDNGERFENATNAAFLEQGKGAPCPDTATLASRLTEAEKNLQAAFPTR